MWAQVEEFIAQLGIREVSPDTAETTDKQLPVKRKLKTAKVRHQQHSEDDDSSAEHAPRDVVSETSQKKKKKGSKLQHNEVSSTTTKTLDWISSYQPRKYLLVKPGGKWYSKRVSEFSIQTAT